MKSPLADKTTEPFTGTVPIAAVMASPSGSESFAKTEVVIPSFKTLVVAPFTKLITSPTPIGGSFTGVILTVNRSSTVQDGSPSKDIKLIKVEPLWLGKKSIIKAVAVMLVATKLLLPIVVL